jgi:hypothetical protein
MAKDLLVAQFHDYGAAHRALCELIRVGILPNRISIVAGDRSNSHGANRDFGILEGDAERYIATVRRGTTLLAVAAAGRERARVAEMIERHAPFDLAGPGSDLAADERQGGRRPGVSS